MAQNPATQNAREPNPLDTSGLCLLSLDGGGVRGLSTLYILKGLMKRLNQQRRDTGLTPVKPCEVFDLIGGTSTGGLIAIMLGRLEMDVDQCITAYTGFMKTVLDRRKTSLLAGPTSRVDAYFDSQELKTAVEEVIYYAGASPTDAFNNDKNLGCRTFVCTYARETAGIERLRSYSLPDTYDIPATICEAALATLAVTSFFSPVTFGARQFVDGTLGVNNPVEEVEGEAATIWTSRTGDLKPLTKCFVSIGTGIPSKTAVEEGIKFNSVNRMLFAIAAETEMTERKFIARWARHYDERRYFRFNVDQGLQVDLVEYKERGRVGAAADEYLDHQSQKFRVRDCAQNLAQKRYLANANFANEIYGSTVQRLTQNRRTPWRASPGAPSIVNPQSSHKEKSGWFKARPCYLVIIFMFLAIAGSATFAIYWTMRFDKMGDAFNAASWMIAVAALILAGPVIRHYPHCTCWNREEPPYWQGVRRVETFQMGRVRNGWQ